VVGDAQDDAQDVDRLRLITKVARLYHARGLRQAEIAQRLRLSQPRVSRLLADADGLGIVRSIVAVPSELNRELEQGLRGAYGLRDVHVVDAVAGAEELPADLGRAAAPFLATALATIDVRTIGFMPWSRTLRHAIETMRPLPSLAGCVVEMLGDLGAPTLQQDVAHQSQRLASLIGADTAFLRVPGVVADQGIRAALLRADPHARRTLRLLDDLDLALLSVGPCAVVPPLRAGDNYFTDEQFDQARRAGAVGQVCLRFLDADGAWVRTPLDDMVVGVTVDQLRRARYRWAVAGGADKYAVLRAALLGQWINRLITDTVTATQLLAAAPA
jgi:DNA-binding transcriptional regulator LsrR (DeoR family)